MANSSPNRADSQVIVRQYFRLLPVQILLIAIPSLNNIISSLFATNALGVDAMSAISMYAPIAQLLSSVGTMMIGGSVILCGRFMGRNEMRNTQHVFTEDISLVTLLALITTAVLLAAGLFDLTGFMNRDAVVRGMFNQYLIGMSLGILPMMIGGQLSAFLSMEMHGSRSTAATAVFVALNLVLTFLFLYVFHLGVIGIAIAASLGYWAYLLIQLEFYVRGRSMLKFKLNFTHWQHIAEIVKIGLPGAMISFYMTIRRSVMNTIMLQYVGNAGLSAFGVIDSLLGIFWAVPLGMAAVGRMLLSVSEGEEDRQSLILIIRTMLLHCVGLVTVEAIILILLAGPFTNLYFHDPSELVYQMTLSGFRLMPICMPLGMVCQTASNYGQVMEKHVLVHSLSLIDGALAICIACVILVPMIGMDGIYYAHIINGVITVIYPVLFAAVVNRKFPTTMDELLMIPKDFGVEADERMDLSMRRMEDVVNSADRIQKFCLSKGIDSRRANYAGLFIEEMAGNVIDHGFHKDSKPHSVDVRVAHKDGGMILRIKDDCIPFNPKERLALVSEDDPMKNLGIRMVYSFATDISYQNILGLNVLTIHL